MGKILITGGSGIIGSRLTELLLKEGFEVNHLGRMESKTSTNNVACFGWDITKRKLDKEAFNGVETIVHLAGANVAEKRWTTERKKEIIDSRVKSGKLIYQFLKNEKHRVKAFISASAVGYYGDCGDEVITEEHAPGKGFLAEVCKRWEQQAIEIGSLGLREVRCRIGIVLAKQGGALPELTKTLPAGFATYFAKANLYYPWVHMDDVCGIMLHAIKGQQVKGAYNTSAPDPLIMKELMQKIIAAKNSKALLVPAPVVAVKLGLGEFSEMLLGSQRCSAQKVLEAGYQFKFREIDKALRNLFQSKT